MSELNPTAEQLIRNVTFTLQRASVIPTPVDPTLQNWGEAADAGAVGEALDNLAVVKKVNNQEPDETGNVALLATQIPVSSDVGAQTVAEAISNVQGKTGSTIVRADGVTETIAESLSAIESAITIGCTEEEIDGLFEEAEE